jgi:hypothetical protein
MKITKSVITITADEEGEVSIKLEFSPSAATKGPMTVDQALAMRAVKAMRDASDQMAKENA